MKKITLLIVFSLLLSLTAKSQQITTSSGSNLLSIPWVNPVNSNSSSYTFDPQNMVACDGVLANYNNLTPDNAGGVTSQDFEAGNDAFDSFAADDFIAPAGGNSTICQISIVGISTGAGLPSDPATLIVMRIYNDAGGVPGAQIFTESFPGSLDANNDGDFILNPTGVPELTAGAKYWLNIQAKMSFGTSGQWFWDTSSDGSNSPYAFQNPGGGFGTGCAAWSPHASCGLAGVADLLMDISFNAVAAGPISVCGTGNPQPIPASGTGGAGCAFPTLSPAAVSATGNIGAGAGDYILDNVQINLTHTWDADLSISLVSPLGTSLDLSSGNGGSADNYTNTIFMDGAPSITTGAAPFTGTFQAEGGTFASTFAGQSINGNWTLRICDGAAGDSGTLLSYCINFTQIITVGDPPLIVCPVDIVANNTTGTCGAVVNFAGIAFDTEDGNISGDIIATPASGSTFAVGDTTVELSVTDSDGNTSTCSFTVTVIDNEAPVAVCQDITVDLDASGTATITAADVDNGSSDNCSIVSYALGIASAPTTGSLSTLYAGGNGGSNGGAVYFDLTVGPNDIEITSIDVNTGEAGTITLNVYTLVGTYVGNTTSAGPWGAVAATGTGTGAGANNPSNVTLASSLTLTAGTTYGIAMVLDGAHAWDYTNGDGTNQNYANANLSLALGATSNVPFTAPTFTPRIFNGGINYSVAAGIVPFSGVFDCSNIGTNTISLVVTDASGNSSTCTSTVTVQDVTAPEIFCIGGFGTFSESEDFEGASIPSGWSTVIESGTQEWTFGSGDMPTGGDFPTNAAIFDDDAAGNTGIPNSARLLSPVYNLTGASNAQLSFDYALQDFIGFGTFEVEVWDGAAWQQILFVNDTDVNPTNSGDIDVSAFANATFQVRYTFDDEDGGWNWGAGVDNFLLTYEATSGGGLDVFLDANGMASIDPNDLVTGVNEACGYTITVGGGGGGGTMGSLATIFGSNNGGDPGGAVYFDVTVGPSDLEVTDIDVNTGEPGTFSVDIYTLVGTYVGNEGNPAPWGAAAATASGTSAGLDSPSNAVLASSITLSANTTYGMALVLDGTHAHAYTNGDGSNQNFSNADMSIALGAASNVPFTNPIFAPRVFNGAIHYTTGGGGGGSGLDFTCADLGENLVEVTVTDDSGNVSTCTAVVNVIDNIAPILVCQDATIELGPDGTATVDPMALLASLPSSYEVMVISGDNQSGSEGFTDFTVGITEAANITFDWDYTSNDPDPGFDGFGYLLNGTYTQLTDPAVGNQSGSAAISVNPGDVFGFRSQTDDNVFGNTETVVSNFLPGFDGQFDPANWNLTLTNSDGDAFFVEIPGGPLSYDACGITILAVDVPTVSCADIGTPITITVFASDASGNIAACTSIITVVDLLAPVLTCPADQTVDPGVGNLFYILPDYIATGEATAIDNCTDPVTNTTQSPAPGTALSDGVYTITMTATDEYGNASTCNFELTVESILGVNQNSLDAGIALYPNPAANVVNLVNKTNISLEKMMIYDINGKLVNQTNLRTMQGEKAIDVSSLAAGVYMVQIIGDNASTVKRLIKE